MRKLVALCMLCLLFVVCGWDALASNVQNETTRLLNYEEWIAPYLNAEALTDTILYAEAFGEDQLEVDIQNPRYWPEKLLRGAIPEYTGTGWMAEVCIVHPWMSVAPQDIISVVINVCEYKNEELEAYIAELTEFGFGPLQDEFVKAQIEEQTGWAQSVRSFQSDDCIFTIICARDEEARFGGYVQVRTLEEGGFEALEEAGKSREPIDTAEVFSKNYVQFSVSLIRQPYVPDRAVSQDTKLNTYENFADIEGIPQDERIEMDGLVYSNIDEAGRLYQVIEAPSKWPKEILGDFLPEYMFSGLLRYMEVSVPADNPTYDQTLIATLHIIDFRAEDVERYAKQMEAYGYRELSSGEYHGGQKTVLDEDAELYRVFAFPGMKCYMSTFEEDGYDTLRITLRYDGRYYMFFDHE